MNNNLYIVWNDNNNIGFPIIDEQHRGIISTINSLYYFIQNGHGNEIIRPTMIMLSQYTQVHFKTEESIIEQAEYPALKEHLSLHKTLLERTKLLSADANTNSDPEMILRFLKQWWLNHINHDDKQYAPYL
jgi:hemerythrin